MTFIYKWLKKPVFLRGAKSLLILRYDFLVKMDLASLPRQARDKHSYRSGTFGVGEEGVAALQAATVCLHTPSSWRYVSYDHRNCVVTCCAISILIISLSSLLDYYIIVRIIIDSQQRGEYYASIVNS
jgi:hypothetical protein